MRIAVTGRSGQVLTALVERGSAAGVEVVSLGRPELDLGGDGPLDAVFAAVAPDAVVSAAAYTAVDKAESEPDLAMAVNGRGAGRVAAAAARLNIPIVHISTDYVFDGSKASAYVEGDAPRPLGIYGQSKLAGERAVAAAHANHAILRTAWIYSPFGNNFLKTMLRLAADRAELRVVADQVGNPTSALDIADAVIAVTRNLLSRAGDETLRGIFHMAGTGETSWADFARGIFALSAERGGPSASVMSIPASDYPTPARRPANSRLSSTRLAQVHGVTMPKWQSSTEATLGRLLASRSAPPMERSS